MFIRMAWLSAKGAKDDKNANAWRSSPFQNIVISLFFSFIFVQIFPRCYTPIFDGLVLVKMQPVHRHRYHHHPTAARKSKPGCTLPWLIINMIGIIGGALSIPSGSTYLIFFDIIRHGLPHGPREAPVDQNGCSTEFCQIPFQPPPSSKRTLCGNYFRQKSVNLL